MSIYPIYMNHSARHITHTRFQREVEMLHQKEHQFWVDQEDGLQVVRFEVEVAMGNAYGTTMGKAQGTTMDKAYGTTMGKAQGSIRLPSNYPFEQPQMKFCLSPGWCSVLALDEYQPIESLFRQHWTADLTLSDLISYSPAFLQKHLLPKKVGWFLQVAHPNKLLAVSLVVMVLARICVGLGNFSGYDNSPFFGDYECHRHWMSISVNLPSTQWYHSSPAVPRHYWPLDYPPLSAHHAHLCGKISQWVEPQSMQLATPQGLPHSHQTIDNGQYVHVGPGGYVSTSHKTLMRLFALLTDLLSFFPWALLLCRSVFSKYHPNIVLAISVLLLGLPSLVLVDHGHFQFNSAFLGLSLAALNQLLQGELLYCALLFSLALNFKVSSLFLALPVFVATLSHIRRLSRGEPAVFSLHVLRVGLVVIVTSLLIWLPCLQSPSDLLLILKAIFPLQRGLYQLQVANFWFVTDRFFRWLRFLSMAQCSLLSACLLLLFSAPSLVLLYRQVHAKSLSLATFSVSLVFYLFSIHVHEKTIMVAAMTSLLCYKQLGVVVIDFQLMGYFTLGALMKQDGLTSEFLLYGVCYFSLAYLLTLYLSRLGFFSRPVLQHPVLSLLRTCLIFLQLSLLYALYFLSPPQHLPFLWPTLTCLLSFLHFLFTYALTSLFVLRALNKKNQRQYLKKKQ